MRKEGWYFVKRYGSWELYEWLYDEDYFKHVWYKPHDEKYRYDDSDFEEINETEVTPDLLK